MACRVRVGGRLYLVATPANMRRVQSVPGVVAWCPTTGEEFSATRGDYFACVDDTVLRGGDGVDCVLAVRRVEYVPAVPR